MTQRTIVNVEQNNNTPNKMAGSKRSTIIQNNPGRQPIRLKRTRTASKSKTK